MHDHFSTQLITACFLWNKYWVLQNGSFILERDSGELVVLLCGTEEVLWYVLKYFTYDVPKKNYCSNFLCNLSLCVCVCESWCVVYRTTVKRRFGISNNQIFLANGS
jgi:hypothetical protein